MFEMIKEESNIHRTCSMQKGKSATFAIALNSNIFCYRSTEAELNDLQLILMTYYELLVGTRANKHWIEIAKNSIRCIIIIIMILNSQLNEEKQKNNNENWPMLSKTFDSNSDTERSNNIISDGTDSSSILLEIDNGNWISNFHLVF